MIAFGISDTLLIKTTLLTKNERVKGASILPFFRKSGQVQQLMILLPDSRVVFLVPFKKGLAKVSFTGVVRLSMDLAELKSHSNFTGAQLDQLYHYDPNWILSNERFTTFGAKKRITQSNCVDYLEKKVRHLLFSRDLSSLEHFVMKSGYAQMHRTIAPETLLGPIPLPRPGKPDGASAPDAPVGWQLNPIWNAWSSFKTFSKSL
jgi:hypothetical protein